MAEVIRRFRASLGDTQRQFADRTRLALTTVARHETSRDEPDRDFPPSQDVLQSFARIARENKLDVFVEIFEGRRKPEDLDLDRQNLAAIKRLLRRFAEGADMENPELTERGRLAIAAFIARDLSAAEKGLSRALPIVDELIQQTAGEMIRNHDPEVEQPALRRRANKS